MKGKAQDYNGIYSDMVEALGEEMTHKIYQYYRGQQVSFPMRLYSKTYTEKYLKQHYNGKNLRDLARTLGYSERWIKQLIDQFGIESKET